MIKELLRHLLVKRRTFDGMSNTHAELIKVTRGVTKSRSENFQDLWVLASTNSKRNGFFVEFGASDGVSGSNTWLLEREYGWDGILAEPSRSSFKELRQNRSCVSDARAVWDKSGQKLVFCERIENYLSSVKDESSGGDVEEEYYVESISLNDLLSEHNAPEIIDYMSVDVEGSELRILQNFFEQKKYSVRLFSIEHNWRQDKKEIIDLLCANNYTNVYSNLSHRDLYFLKKDL